MKFLMVFFVISYFRDFVKKTFFFSRFGVTLLPLIVEKPLLWPPAPAPEWSEHPS